MSFLFPEHLWYLVLLFPAVLLAGYGVFKKLNGRRALAMPETDGTILPKQGMTKLIVRRLLLVSGVGLLLFAFAGPMIYRGEKPERRKGVDVVFMLDVSNSMLARDILPDRLSHAKSEILHISRTLGDGRRALMLFAGSPLVQCPLTTDQAAFEVLLDVASPELIESQGTVYRRAFVMAMRLLDSSWSILGSARQVTEGEKVIVLLSDGEEHGRDFRDVAETMKSRGIHLYAVGVGTGEAVPIPLPASGQRPAGLKRDERGGVVLTRFRPEVFAALVGDAGGTLVYSRPEKPAYEAVASSIGQLAAFSRWVMVPYARISLALFCVAAALLLLFVELQMSDTAAGRGKKKSS